MRRAVVLNGGSHCYAGDCGGSKCTVYYCGIYHGMYKPKYGVFTPVDYKKQIVCLDDTILKSRTGGNGN